MKVGFDISQLAHSGGVTTYTNNLSYQLSQIADLDMVYFYSSLRKPYKGDLKGVKQFKLPPTLFEVLFNKFHSVSIEKFIGEVDIFHSSDWVQPPSRAKKVTTYHDVIPLKYPQWSHPKIVAVHKRRLELVEKEIDMVIAVSEATKKDLMEVTKIPEEKIRVVYEGVSDKFKVVSDDKKDQFRKKYNLPERFILAIGGIGSRRNLERVKKACRDYPLVIAGETISRLSEDEMILLYNCAEVLLYPSLYEGFGLPVLEAMACGTPVITSNVSSLPEVAGDAAILVDPEDQNEIDKKLRQVMESSALKQGLIKKGFVQAKKFNWEKSARETVRIYEKVLR